MPPTRATQARSTRWSLEVVRGRDVGQRVRPAGGRDRPGQRARRGRPAWISATRRPAHRGGWPRARRCSRRRARTSSSATWTRRAARSSIASGCSPARPGSLQPGDEIQLGGVQLRVVRSPGSRRPAAARPPPPASATSGASGRLPEPYAIDGHVSCRTWDDFLVVAAQRWRVLRDELASGRLADYLRRIQRTDLLPHPDREPLARRAARPVAGPAARDAIQCPRAGRAPRQPGGPDRPGRHDAPRAADHQRRLSAPAEHGPGRAGRHELGQAGAVLRRPSLRYRRARPS